MIHPSVSAMVRKSRRPKTQCQTDVALRAVTHNLTARAKSESNLHAIANPTLRANRRERRGTGQEPSTHTQHAPITKTKRMHATACLAVVALHRRSRERVARPSASPPACSSREGPFPRRSRSHSALRSRPPASPPNRAFRGKHNHESGSVQTASALVTNGKEGRVGRNERKQ